MNTRMRYLAIFQQLKNQLWSYNHSRLYSQELLKLVNEALKEGTQKEGFELVIDKRVEKRKTRTQLYKESRKPVLGKPVEEKILFNSFIEENNRRLGFKELLKNEQERLKSDNRKRLESEATSIAARLLSRTADAEDYTADNTGADDTDVKFPFQAFTPTNETTVSSRSVKTRLPNLANVETTNDNFDEEWMADYGTADPNLPVSEVPCFGCGAHLHCKDSGLPGFVPSETFKVLTKRELYRTLCQRCFFLREHKMALKVSVSPEDYVDVISEIKGKLALVLLIVDILDFPSSIWPGLLELIGSKRPVVLVGNKVDLVPLDGKGSLDRMKMALIESASAAGLNKVNLKHVALVSSKTGFGIEELITKLWNSWKNKGDIYILGCTNVGKSSLFNALLQSDLCKSDAVDLIDRATTSIWPGTTLNLLKFPLASPSAIRVYERTQRLIAEREKKALETQLQKEQVEKTQNPVYASLMGKIGRTFLSKQEQKKLEEGETDPFSLSSSTIPSTGDPRPIYDPNDLVVNRPKFCLDSPGTVSNDQLLTLLTMKELELVVPREYIRPRSFLIRPGMTLLLAGLGQIDFVDGSDYIILTVFSSNGLPVTVLPTEEVANFFEECKNTPLVAVPTGGEERMKQWPSMEFKEFEMKGMLWDESYADVTLSSAGWVAVTLGARKEAKLRVGTPDARGIYMRKPPLLPRAVNLRGKKIRASPAYRGHKVVFSH